MNMECNKKYVNTIFIETRLGKRYLIVGMFHIFAEIRLVNKMSLFEESSTVQLIKHSFLNICL